MIFFTSDEHYGHHNIIKYCNRPFKNTDEMDTVIITNYNEVVQHRDLVIHLGDFTLKGKKEAEKYISELPGKHVFIKGSHDYWNNQAPMMLTHEFKDKGIYLVLCHYCLRSWPRSHWNSWHLFGHHHGSLEPIGKSWDVSVDNNNFYPVSLDQVIEIMNKRPDNFDYIGKGRG